METYPPLQWLVEKVDIVQVEEKHMIYVEDENRKVAFGYMNELWEMIKGKIQKGDELWEFNSPQQSWEMLAGRHGYVVMRNNKPIDYIEDVIN